MGANALALALAVAVLMVTSMVVTDPGGARDADTWRRELLDWRAKHVADLQKPDGWLSLAGLEWLEPGDTSFGGSADNKIHLANSPAAQLGVLEFKDGVVRLVAPAGGFPQGFLVAGKPAAPQVLSADADNDKNAVHMTIGALDLYVIRRSDRFALRVKDTKSQALQSFHGLKWYEPDEHYRVQAKWIAYNPPKSITVLTLAGTSHEQPVPGEAEFTLDGETFRLEPAFEEDPPRLFFVLRDATSTSTTYGACRFLYTSLPSHGLTQDGELTLDFNHLENPPCAYTPFATCPLPPPGNRLHIALPVGELRYHD